MSSRSIPPRLFVDCDDTLVLWPDDALDTGTSWELNLDLIHSIGCFLDTHPEYFLVVWSGGGVDYAERWARMAFSNYTVLPKDVRNEPQDQDILVDDMAGEIAPRDSRVRVVADLRRCPLCARED